MTGATWADCSNPGQMLAAVGARLSDRQLMLFVCGAARRVWDLLPDTARTAVPLIERAADADTAREREAGIREAVTVVTGNLLLGFTLTLFRQQMPSSSLARSASSLLHVLESNKGGDFNLLAAQPFELLQFFNADEEWVNSGQAATLRCVVGNPFHQAQVAPEWRTADAFALASGIYAENAFDRLPILADALQDAGCDCEHLLDHLRSGGPHTRGCWVVDAVVGRA